MTETPREIEEELPPELEAIIYGFEQLSITLAPRPPLRDLSHGDSIVCVCISMH